MINHMATQSVRKSHHYVGYFPVTCAHSSSYLALIVLKFIFIHLFVWINIFAPHWVNFGCWDCVWFFVHS